MWLWDLIMQTARICFTGMSVFSSSFILSLFLGTAADHPILGSLPTLIGYLEFIGATSVVLAIVTYADNIYRAKKRLSRVRGSVHRNTYSLVR